MAAAQEGQGIQVLVRVRPANEREKHSNRFCVEVDEAQRAVVLSRSRMHACACAHALTQLRACA